MANFLDLLKGEGETIEFIKKAAETTKSATEILESLKAQGLGIRRQTGLQVISYLRENTIPARSYIASVNLTKLPTISRLPLSLTNQLRNFAYKALLTGVNSLTGEEQTRSITVSSSQLLTKQEALDIATSIADSDSQSGGLNGSTGVIAEITQNNAGLVFP